jgi:hypothetical protein
MKVNRSVVKGGLKRDMCVSEDGLTHNGELFTLGNTFLEERLLLLRSSGYRFPVDDSDLFTQFLRYVSDDPSFSLWNSIHTFSILAWTAFFSASFCS